MLDDPHKRKEEIVDNLAPTIITEPLRSRLNESCLARLATPPRFDIIIEANYAYAGGISKARGAIIALVAEIAGSDALSRNQIQPSRSYVFASLTADQILALARRDGSGVSDATTGRPARAIFRVWESMKIGPLTTASICTVKADAAQRAYGACGKGIVWAIVDSGIQADHPHFSKYQNLILPAAIADAHKSFVPGCDPRSDPFGHGTHVAGIVAGGSRDAIPQAACQAPDQSGNAQFVLKDVPGIKGMAPTCKLVSLQVLGANGNGDATSLIQALEYVELLNDYGRKVVVHGLNISAGYPFDPRWYGCGQTPVCKAVDRLVLQGVVVVVAAGNTGYVTTMVNAGAGTVGSSQAGQLMSVNDPGNADLAITVGSTDREKPHQYGVSYFSSKGPTSDGRSKPDVIAPGESIISAATGQSKLKVPPSAATQSFDYIEDTGTSMAAPHVSGIIAGFLSVRPEFIGKALEISELIRQSAMSLKRDPNLQGRGLVDMMNLLQSV
ncbi:MAG TPA: S8 family peptidase [Candidatus Tumulicola sp.]|nr:S8 family peptidase [Candidatus Tumulicola sp.]